MKALSRLAFLIIPVMLIGCTSPLVPFSPTPPPIVSSSTPFLSPTPPPGELTEPFGGLATQPPIQPSATPFLSLTPPPGELTKPPSASPTLPPIEATATLEQFSFGVSADIGSVATFTQTITKRQPEHIIYSGVSFRNDEAPHRDVSIRMDCEGTGIEDLTWAYYKQGNPSTEGLICGSMAETRLFNPGGGFSRDDEIIFRVTIPAENEISITYTLTVTILGE